MDGRNGNGARISGNDSHDLRDALAVTKGWLEVVFRKWGELSEEERFRCVAGALLGANQMVFKLERMDGVQIDLTEDGPELRMAEEFWKLAEQNGNSPSRTEASGSQPATG
ncbi:MAG TPA: hypothetical protein VJ927_12945 [Actinomycetota bacterium]|nr:hypothetical protein [Actinomycetota bacterium]